MANTVNSDVWARPWYVKGLAIALAPFMLIISTLVMFPFFACIFLYALVVNCLFEYGVRSRMRRCGRYLPLSEARGRITEHRGTLIIEKPALGWGLTHAWWTPDNLLAISPFTAPTDEDRHQAIERWECLDWDRWCWDNYTSPDSGQAFLLRVWNGAILESKLTKWFPGLIVVHTWTALAQGSRPPQNPIPKTT